MCQQSLLHETPLPPPPFDTTSLHQEDLPPTSPTLCRQQESRRELAQPSSHRHSLIQRTLTLYDWDDTFFPSTFLAALGVRIDQCTSLPDSLCQQLADLEDIVLKIVKEAMQYGIVKVITNAEQGWVELSGNRFMPRLTKFLQANSIKVVSARSTYEPDYPECPASWKTAAFVEEVRDSFPNADSINVLVLGDSLSEREAAHNLATRMPAACVKSVKLVERPDVTQLQRQIALLHGSFRDLRDHYGSFDINLTC
ncbi:hypothetical protein BWQ96_08873 [Gracilariopsis chorda]|uniref:Uncharacterized protein n=1 Tax=Gracilariopsis chorda TaxID=448386 RepID=A0A2V3IH05_9FLOR|nr:hypothetical protein BWQ96_08873 [Gracilariopsis chorda]|eukprot:PXF41375.1 hypothetical protein BWQ96_08873 [Gracilariopsis chorda]